MGVLSTYLYAIIGIIVVGLFFLFLWLLCRLLEKVMRRRMASCDTAIQANRFEIASLPSFFMIFAIIGAIAGIILLALCPRLKKMMGDAACEVAK